MFVGNHMLKRFSGGVAVAAFVVVVAVPSAFAGSFITDTLGGNGSTKATPDAFERAVAIHNATQASSTAYSVKAPPDALERYLGIHGATPAQVRGGTGRNGRAYVNAGMSATVATSNDGVHFGVPTLGLVSTGGTGFNWGDAGIGAGFVAGLALLLLIGGPRLRGNKSRVLAT
jgi:hypothetical protein